MLSFLTEIFSKFLSKLNMFAEQLSAVLRKSKSTKEDVEKMHKIHIRNSLIRETDEVTRVVSTIPSPERNSLIAKQIIASGRHSETTPLWTEQAPRKAAVTKTSLLNSIGQQRGRSRSLWHGRGRGA